MATTTYFGWTTPDDTALVKDGAAAIRSLGSAIDASMQDLEGGTTGQFLSKNSNTDMDFIWALPPSGGMTLLSTTTLSGATVDVTSISQAYKYLHIEIIEPTNASSFNLRYRLNNSATANYVYQYTQTSSTAITNELADTQFYANTSANYDTGTIVSVIRIYNYNATTSRKLLETITLGEAAGVRRMERANQAWFDDTAVTSIRFYPNTGSFTGGTVLVYGVK